MSGGGDVLCLRRGGGLKAEKLLLNSEGFPAFCQVVCSYLPTCLFFFFSACSPTVMNFSHFAVGNLTAQGAGVCALWALGPVHDVKLNKTHPHICLSAALSACRARG